MFEEAMLLLEQPTLQVDELPCGIEQLNICAFDVQSRITDLADACSVIEEQATAEASSESNADQRKARRCELLRADEESNQSRAEMRHLERLRCCLTERSHRPALNSARGAAITRRSPPFAQRIHVAMKPHQLYEIAVRRGTASHIDREMGYHTNGEMARRWRRPDAAPDNLFTVPPAPLVRGKQELLAHDRVNPDAADILLFDLFVAVALQRAVRAKASADSEQARLEIMRPLAQSFLMACEALAGHLTPTEQEEKLWQAGGAVVRAILFLLSGDDGAAQYALVA